MKLYIWVDPYKIVTGASMVIAVAENVDEARKIALEGSAWYYGDQPLETRDDVVQTQLGEPTRILDLPCAEWYEWAE